MTVVSSFTLCPPAASSTQFVVEDKVPEKVADEQSKKRKEISASDVAEKSVALNGPVVHVVNRHHYPVRSTAYQATPFHPLVHHRNLPRNGIISPLKVGEYNVEMYHRYHTAPPQPQHPVVEIGGNACRPRLACDPPLAEIQIPSGSAAQNSDEENHDEEDANSWIAGESGEHNDYEEHSFERLESWKSMYFVAQRDLHVAREVAQSAMDENRRLKRHLFELQRRLYESQRKRQRLANDMWKVPGPSEQQGSRRPAPSPHPEEKDSKDGAEVVPAEALHRVPRAISSEESSACRGDASPQQKQEEQPVKPRLLPPV